MSGILTLGTLQTAIELGLIYSFVALALFLSYSMLNVCDLSTDGCFILGCATGAMVALAGHPFLALAAAVLAGIVSGFITAQLQTRFGVESILAGIIVNTGLYTINIFVMGNKSNLNLNTTDTVFTYAKSLLSNTPFAGFSRLLVALFLLIISTILLVWFLHTRLGLSIRATGDNIDMVRASSINPTFTITAGLCVANAFTGLGGCLLGEYQKSCDINGGTGMVTIALASLIIGETLSRGRGTVLRRALFVVFGSCLYRIIVAVAMRMNMPASALKLVSAIIVAIAIATPHLKKKYGDYQQKRKALKAETKEVR